MGKIYKYANIILDNVQKIKRKKNAIILRSQIHRIKVYIMLLTILLLAFNSVFAIENTKIEYGDYVIKCNRDPNLYVTYNGIKQVNYEYYCIKNEKEHSVYCINLGLNGAENLANGYNVEANNNVEDETLQSIVLNCYPYKSIEELGVSSISKAKFASQFAIWTYTSNLDLNKLSAIGDENQDVVNAIKNIYNSGISNIGNYNVNLETNISEQKYIVLDGKKYYKKDISINNKNNIKDIKILTNDKNVKIIETNNKYSIYIPVELVEDEYNVKLNMEIIAKENASLLGMTTISGYQDVVITLDDIFYTSISEELNFKSTKSEFLVIKKDKDTKKPLEGVGFRIKDENGNDIGVFKTDAEGKIYLNLYNSNKIYVQEVETLKDYVIDRNNYELNLNNKLEIFNEKKKGKITIIKKTKEYNELTNLEENTPLSNVSFYIYDEDMNIVDDITTDENGYISSKRLPVGKYYIKEYKTQDGYKLLDEFIEVEIVENDDNVNVEILNENVDIPPKLPKTGL